MSKNVQYIALGLVGVIVVLGVLKYRKETTEPKIDAEMEELIKRIDEAKK